MIRIRWTGAAGLEFTYRNQTLLVDPYHSRPSKRDLFLNPLIPRPALIERYLKTFPSTLAGIIVGHTHFDHALDIPVLAGCFKGPVIGSKSLDRLMRIHGLGPRTVICRGNERIIISEHASVTMIPSTHGRAIMGRIPFPGQINATTRLPLRAPDYRLGDMFNPKLIIGNTSILHVGSAGLPPNPTAKLSCDVLFLCVPGWKKTPDYPETIIEKTNPDVIVPFHFDDFTRPVPANGAVPLLPFLDMPGFLKRVNRIAPKATISLPGLYEALTI